MPHPPDCNCIECGITCASDDDGNESPTLFEATAVQTAPQDLSVRARLQRRDRDTGHFVPRAEA